MLSEPENTQGVVARFPHVNPPDSRRHITVQEKRAVQEKHPESRWSLLFRCMLIVLVLLFLNILLVLNENSLLLAFYSRLTSLTF